MADPWAGVDVRSLFELAGDATFLLDAEGLILDANAMSTELLDRPTDHLVGHPVSAFHPENERGAIAAVWQQGVRAEALPCTLERPDGSRFACELRVLPLGAERVLFTYRDVSERQRALEDIHLRNVAIGSVASGVTIADARQPDIPLIYVNRGFEKLTGYHAQECVGRSCRFLQADDRDQPALDEVRAALKEGRDCNVRLRNYRKDGTLFWNDLHLSPVYNEAEELTHFVGIQLDVTERVVSRQRLEASERRYRLLAESVEDMIARFNRQGQFEYVSPASRRVLGTEPETLLGRNRESFIHPDDLPTVREAWRNLVRGREGVSLSYRMLCADGSYRWVEATESLADPEGGPDFLVVSVCRDITLRKKAEEEVRRALEREKELNEMKTRFIGMVSHEFRTPMTGLRASAAFLRSYGDSAPPAKRERHFQNIETALKRMNDMLDDVLLVSRAESGKLPFNPRPLPLEGFCRELLEDLRVIYPDREVTLNCQLPADASYALDKDLLLPVLQNLVSNALKYSQAPAPVAVRVSEETGHLILEVEDRGIGVPPADQSLLFEPFHRAGNVGNIRGTGLGLNITRRAVERHGGEISFRSIPGQGTCFTVKLPRVVLSDLQAV